MIFFFCSFNSISVRFVDFCFEMRKKKCNDLHVFVFKVLSTRFCIKLSISVTHPVSSCLHTHTHTNTFIFKCICVYIVSLRKIETFFSFFFSLIGIESACLIFWIQNMVGNKHCTCYYIHVLFPVMSTLRLYENIIMYMKYHKCIAIKCNLAISLIISQY